MVDAGSIARGRGLATRRTLRLISMWFRSARMQLRWGERVGFGAREEERVVSAGGARDGVA
jgi:hypothetical protein|tara:strand:- start:40 stop:222 length:183 start_codon:yes stop_codon:yes gene_type:complete